MITLLLECLHVLHNITLLSTISELEFSVCSALTDTLTVTRFKPITALDLLLGKRLCPISEERTTDALDLVAVI